MEQSNERFGHPKGLYYLFFAELWERFSFYGMRALLVLYMTKKLLFSDEMSFGIFAAYMSLVYVTPLIGGILAERITGYRNAILIGGILMALGHFFLTFETSFFFYFSLGLIIVGNGFFKPNISSLVGQLYGSEDPRRDSGFTIFYLGVNIGATIAPLLCAWIAELYGWHYGFVLAGIGMLAGLVTFRGGIRKGVFADHGLAPAPLRNSTGQLSRPFQFLLLGIVLAVPTFSLLVKYYHYEHILLWLVSFFLIIYLTIIFRSVSLAERKQLCVVLYFTIIATLFMIIFEQAGSSLTLFADRNVNLVGMNAAQTNSINAGFIMLLAIPFAVLWSFLSKRKINPSSPLKMGLGLLLLGAGFVVFGMSANEVDLNARVPMFYLILGTFIYTVGELFLSPIGLSKMTELSPKKYMAFIMGVWFLSSFYGHFFAGKLAQLTSANAGSSFLSSDFFLGISHLVTGMDPSTGTNGEAFGQLYGYVSTYAVFGVIAMVIGFIAMLLTPMIKRLMGEVH